MKKIMTIAGMTCVVALVAGCSFFFDRKEHPLTINTIPKDATVLVDGVEYKPPVSKKVSASKDITISVYREGYKSRTVKATSSFVCGGYEFDDNHFLIELEKK